MSVIEPIVPIPIVQSNSVASSSLLLTAHIPLILHSPRFASRSVRDEFLHFMFFYLPSNWAKSHVAGVNM